MVSPKNLQDDPLRLLRAYRQAAQLNFTLEPTTHSTIRQLASLLNQIAAERVQVELGYLLKSSLGSTWLQAAWQDNLLQGWFPDATAERLAQLSSIDRSSILLSETWPELGKELNTSVSSKSASLLSLAKLTCLLPPTPEIAQEQLLHLKYSRAEIRVVQTALQHLPQLVSQAISMSIREQYFFFQNVGTVFPALAVLAVASSISVEELAPLINRYLNPNDPVAHPTPIITGKDLMRSLNLPPSPQIGELLTTLGVAQAEGKISTAEDALKWAAQMIDNRSNLQP
jgi:tRNA nucleotidyltransferase (CCA-adding enzyme)